MSEFPKYIWFAPDDTSRNPYAAFRRTFTIQPPGDIKAEFHIFADTQYDLFVNGRFVGYGPARFDPRRPQYDSYDLSGFLTEGKNVIAVLANFVGHKTFKSIPGTAAMIAWGEAKCGGRKTDLSTGSGWKCLRHAAYNRYAPKLSFALGAQAFYDQAAFDSGWTGADYDDSAWPEAVEVSAGGQSRLGRLTAREIPFMSLEPVAAAADTRVFPLADNEERYSFSLELPFTYATANDPQDAYCRTVAWSTYVYSPREQAVSSSILYDKIWVNGVAAETFEDPSRQLRRNFIMRLNQGWNYVFGTADMGEDVYNLYLTLPKGCGLTLSAGKNPESGLLFRHTRVMPKEYAAEISSIPAPWPEDADISPVGGWTYTASADAASSPNRESGLDTYGPPAETVSPDKLNGFVIEKSIYPDGAALVIDVGHMRLLFPCLRLRGVKGAAIDLVYGDRYAADGMHLRERSWIPLADRLVCSEDVIAWMPIQPRGFRYLSITLRNAPADVVIESLSFLSGSYPVKKTGSFECSDPLLNRIWEAGALTQSVNMEDAYDDCVDRERGLYALDTLIQYHVNLACFGDQRLMKRCLELFDQSVHPSGLYRCVYPNAGDYILPDFALYVIDGFYSYFRHTGDAEFIRKCWPSITTDLSVFHALAGERADLLLRADYPDGRVPGDKRIGFLGDGEHTNNTGINCLYSCLYLIALRGAETMAGAIGEEEDAAALGQRIARLEQAIPEAFWSAERGLFADNTDKTDFSPHASLFAVKAGVASAGQKEILRGSLPPLLTPFFKNGYDPAEGFAFTTSYGLYMLDGMYRLGLAETAENVMRQGWGWFLAKGVKTTPELFSLDDSLCHAWSASPTYMLSRNLLGVNFDRDGQPDHILIDVRAGNVAWARGVYPHRLGDVRVAWHKEGGRIVYDEIRVPAGVSFEIGDGKM